MLINCGLLSSAVVGPHIYIPNDRSLVLCQSHAHHNSLVLRPEPPGRPVIVDAERGGKTKLIEPYNEGSDVALICEVNGGEFHTPPSPTVAVPPLDSLDWSSEVWQLGRQCNQLVWFTHRTPSTKCDVVFGQHHHRLLLRTPSRWSHRQPPALPGHRSTTSERTPRLHGQQHPLGPTEQQGGRAGRLP